MSMMKTYTFYIHGMHCQSCVLLTETTFKEIEGVQSVTSSLSSKTVEISGDFATKSTDEIIELLTKAIEPHGYTVSLTPPSNTKDFNDFNRAIPLAGIIIFLFLALQKSGILDIMQISEMNYTSAFLLGIIASVSTCMAVVGGLVLSVSANYAKTNSSIFPQLSFHAGRLISFFLLGGILGAIGSFIELSLTATFILNTFVALVLLILGINLLDLFPRLTNWQPTMPKALSRHIHTVKTLNHTLAPALLGAFTFFLPCGFTQSMQLFTLTTGNFLTGAFTMSIFALGTLPVLLLLSFGSFKAKSETQKSLFFKTSGIIVIFFALLNLLGALALIGITPSFNLF